MKKQIFLDAVGAIGMGSLSVGIYLQYGLPNALMSGGGLLLLFALLASRSNRKS